MLLLILLSATVLLNVVYFLRFSKFSLADTPTPDLKNDFPVSVIICAKNEAQNLKENIPLILKQDYPHFELILINDASSDETQDVIEQFAEEDSRVKSVEIENNEAFWSNKKYSLTLGIKKAKHSRLLFTDADCKPASDQWIRLMTTAISEEKQLVLGYGAYEKRKGLLNRLIRFETVMTAIQYFSYAKAGMPYMGVGRNLAYTTQLFYDNRGFMSHMQVPSGDDDLFVNEAATHDNVALVYRKEAFTYSKPKESWHGWLRQKRRHVSTAKYYKSKHQWLLGAYYIGNLLFWILGILAFTLVDWKLPLAIVIFRITLQYIFIRRGMKLLQEKELLPFLPFYEVFLVLIHLTIFILNSISKQTRWK